MFWNQILHGRSVAVFWLSNVQKNDHLNLEKCSRQLTRMMDLMPSDFAAINSTLPACDFKQAKLHKARWAIQLLNIFSECQIGPATSRYFQEQSSTVTFILKFFPYKIVNLLNISSVFNFKHFSQNLEGFKADIAFIYTRLAMLVGDLNFDLTFLTRNFIGSCVKVIPQYCIAQASFLIYPAQDFRVISARN